MAKSRPTSSAPKRAVFSSSSTKPARSSGSASSKKANNVSGYEHRKAKEDPSLSLDPLDAFDLITQHHKRSAITTDLSRDEAGTGKGRGGGPKKSGEDEEEGDDAVRERIRQMIASGESMGVVEEDDDEEVDSDGAWEEMGDEQMSWGGAFVERTGRGKKQGGKKTKAPAQVEVNLDEDEDLSDAAPTTKAGKPALRFQLPDSHNAAAEDSADDDFDSDEGGSTGFMDLSTMLDGPMSDREDFDDANAQDEEDEGMSEDDDDEGESDDDEEDSDEEMSEGEDEDDEGALDQLGAFVSGLKSAKRKAGEDGEDDGGTQRSKRRVLKDRGEDGRKEGDFGAPLTKGSKLSLSALLQPLPQSSSHSLLQTAKALAPAALAAPLPTRAQDKLDREAAYDATKEEVEKWAPAMKRIKEAEHLSFPLQAQKKATASSSAMTAKFKPTNDLESSVARLLASAQMSEADLAKTEDLAMNHLTIEEVAARREELGRLRELMFRAEAKNKRVAKIKSKAYRKIAKKEREKNAQKIADAGFESGEDGEEAQMELERKRATERATLRHKNTGKWAKSMLGRTELDVDQRRELNEQLQQGDRLKKKIQQFGDEDGEESSSEEEEGEDVEAIRRRAYDQLEELDGEEDEVEGGKKKKGDGLFQMKFMQDGMKRAQAGADAQAEQARRDLGATQEGDESADDEPAAGPSFVSVGGNKGRMLYGTGAVTAPKTSAVAPPSEMSVASTSTLQSSHLSPPISTSKPSTSSAPAAAPEVNPWLTAQVDSKQSRKKNLVTGGKDAQGVDKVAAQLKKGMKKTDEGRAKERDDAEVEIDLSVGLMGPGTAKKGKGKGKAAKATEGAGGDDEDESEDGEDDLRVGPTAFRQRDLVAQAFAGDNVIEDFAAEKRREEEEDAPREEDLTLPGWGAWGGRGVKKARNPKKFIKKVAGIDVAKRHDFGKSNVIISEKKDKKAAKYQTKDLPYPYTSAAQYEASLAQAVGTEWATRTTHQKLTMPRVVVKKGAVIHPLHKNAV